MTPRPRPTGPRPRAALPPSEAAIIASLAHETRQSTRDLVASTGFSLQVVNQGLHRLRGTGMVAFEDGKDGTIHATFGLVLGPWNLTPRDLAVAADPFTGTDPDA